MNNNYETYYKNLLLNIEGLAENPDRLTVPELLDELTELAICNRNLLLNEEIEEVFSYQLNRANALFINNSEAVALFELRSIFNFNSKMQFIMSFKYDDDVIRFLDQHFEKFNYIMDYLKNKVDFIIAEHTSEDLDESDLEKIKASDEDNDGE